MEIVIVWYELSEIQIREIFDYYTLEANEKIADFNRGLRVS